MNKTYVYNGTEVKLTGREAEKQLRKKVIKIHEITPCDMEDGSWKKWVQMVELYEIKDNTP